MYELLTPGGAGKNTFFRRITFCSVETKIQEMTFHSLSMFPRDRSTVVYAVNNPYVTDADLTAQRLCDESGGTQVSTVLGFLRHFTFMGSISEPIDADVSEYVKDVVDAQTGETRFSRFTQSFNKWLTSTESDALGAQSSPQVALDRAPYRACIVAMIRRYWSADRFSTNGSLIQSCVLCVGNIIEMVKSFSELYLLYCPKNGVFFVLGRERAESELKIHAMAAPFELIARSRRAYGLPFSVYEGICTPPASFSTPRYLPLRDVSVTNSLSEMLVQQVAVGINTMCTSNKWCLDHSADIEKGASYLTRIYQRLYEDWVRTEKEPKSKQTPSWEDWQKRNILIGRGAASARVLLTLEKGPQNLSIDPTGSFESGTIVTWVSADGEKRTIASTVSDILFNVDGALVVDSIGAFMFAPAKAAGRGGLNTSILTTMTSSTLKPSVILHASLGKGDPMSTYDLTGDLSGGLNVSQDTNPKYLGHWAGFTSRFTGRSVLHVMVGVFAQRIVNNYAGYWNVLESNIANEPNHTILVCSPYLSHLRDVHGEDIKPNEPVLPKNGMIESDGAIIEGDRMVACTVMHVFGERIGSKSCSARDLKLCVRKGFNSFDDWHKSIVELDSACDYVFQLEMSWFETTISGRSGDGGRRKNLASGSIEGPDEGA